MHNRFILLLLLCIATLSQCAKKVDDFRSDAIADYQNLEVGKYITYKLDSTVKIPLNDTGFTTRSYLARDVVEQSLTDNAGRPSWRVVRYLRDTSSKSESDWKPGMTYLVTVTRQAMEVVENNLRFIKLNLPVTENATWFGNKYLDNSDPLASLFSFNNDNVMGSWEYNYQQLGAAETIENKPYENIITVSQTDQSTNYPVKVDFAYGSRDYGIEKYAKNIGLVYKELTMLEYQPKNDVFPRGYKTGFTIRMRIIDHN